MLKNRAPKIKKYYKNDSQMGPKEWLYFGGNAYWGAFGGPNRFCDEKIGPQRSQSAPKNEQWAKITEKWAKHEPTIEKELQKWILFATKNDAWKQSSNHEKNTNNEFKQILQKWTII